MEEKTEPLEFKFTRKKPRKGATNETHIFKTVADITSVLNKSNYKRFLDDFKCSLEIQFALQESINAMASADAKQDIEIPLISHTFEWIDD